MKVERNNRHVMKWKLCIHKLFLFVSVCILTLYAVIEKCINCNLKLLTCGGQNMSKSKKNIYPQPGRKSNCFNKTWYFSQNCSTLETFILHWKHLFSNTSILFPICKCDMHFYFDYLRWYFWYICLFYVHWRRNDLLL